MHSLRFEFVVDNCTLLILWRIIGASEGIRTLDFNLGKVALYP